MRIKNIVFLLVPLFGISILCSSEHICKNKEKVDEGQRVESSEFKFKKWLSDICIILMKNEKVQKITHQDIKPFIVSEDSLSLELHEIIFKTIYKNEHFPNIRIS